MTEYKNTIAEIQEDVISQRIRIAELEKENAELRTEVTKRSQTIADKTLKIAKLFGIIEKMKCCQNCEYQTESAAFCEDCYNYAFNTDKKDKWKLAE